MRICRFTHGYDKTPRPGVIIGTEIADLSATRLAHFPTHELAWDPTLSVETVAASANRLDLDAVQLHAPVVPPTFLAIGLNYRAHAAEGGRADPDVPVVFNKQISCIIGPDTPVRIPPEAPDLVDYEGELGVVIGPKCRRVPADRAHEVIAGYVVVNDVSVRDWQKASPTMTMGKSWDTHGPIGPWLVSADEVPEPNNLTITTTVDGEVRQQANTSEMIFDIGSLIAHLSTAFTLLPGTIIATGTPEGVGFYRSPRAMLEPGQVVTVDIEAIGSLSNPVIADPDAHCIISTRNEGPSQGRQ